MITDLDGRDRAARAALAPALRARREQLGLSQRAVAAPSGHDAAMVRRLERLGGDQARATTFMWWARAVGWRLRLEPVGFPDLTGRPGGVFAAMRATLDGDGDDVWQVAALTGELAAIRVACGVKHDQLAALFGLTDQAISDIERSPAASALVLLQRHARGIAICARRPGAYLAVRLEPYPPVV